MPSSKGSKNSKKVIKRRSSKSSNASSRTSPLNLIGNNDAVRDLAVMLSQQKREIMDVSELQAEASKIRKKSIQSVIINLIAAIAIIFAAYKFFMSDAYLSMLQPAGQIKFLKNFSRVLIMLLKYSDRIASKIPIAYNTVSLVSNAHAVTLAKNLLTNPRKTINNYKRLGLSKRNVPKIALAAGTGAVLNMLPAKGGRYIGKTSMKGAVAALETLRKMKAKDMERAYLTGTVVGGFTYLRDTIEFFTRHALQQAAVTVVSSVVVHGHNVVKESKKIVSPLGGESRKMIKNK